MIKRGGKPFGADSPIARAFEAMRIQMLIVNKKWLTNGVEAFGPLVSFLLPFLLPFESILGFSSLSNSLPEYESDRCVLCCIGSYWIDWEFTSSDRSLEESD